MHAPKRVARKRIAAVSDGAAKISSSMGQFRSSANTSSAYLGGVPARRRKPDATSGSEEWGYCGVDRPVGSKPILKDNRSVLYPLFSSGRGGARRNKDRSRCLATSVANWMFLSIASR